MVLKNINLSHFFRHSTFNFTIRFKDFFNLPIVVILRVRFDVTSFNYINPLYFKIHPLSATIEKCDKFDAL